MLLLQKEKSRALHFTIKTNLGDTKTNLGDTKKAKMANWLFPNAVAAITESSQKGIFRAGYL